MTILSSDKVQSGLLPQEEMLETLKKKNEFLIGIPKESNEYEWRVALTPQSVKLLIEDGHSIIIQSGAGEGSNYTDKQYAEAGAQVASSMAEVFLSDIILKIAPLKLLEMEHLKNHQIVISALHAASQSREQIKTLMEKRVTAIAFELLKEENHYPVVCSMSEISGIASITVAAELLSKAQGGKGVLLGGVTGISPSDVIILGAGTAAEFAARAAIGMGAQVQVFDSSLPKLRKLQHNLNNQISTSVLQYFALKKSLAYADVVIGALEGKEDNPFRVSEDMVKTMKKGSVVIDLNVDNDPTFETSQMTTLASPTFTKHGVIHYCAPNIASRTARTSSVALSNIFAPLLMRIASAGGLNHDLKQNISIRNGVYLFNGILTNEKLANTFNLPWRDIDLLVAIY